MSDAFASPDVLIVGGGIVGCSIAWHAKRLGPEARILILERHRALATQATSQAAALLTRARTNAATIPLVARTYAAIAELAEELGRSLPLHPVGSLHVAASESTGGALRTLTLICAGHGLCFEEPDPAELGRLVPWLDTGAVRQCLLMPDDAYIDPYLLADAYASAARLRGAEFRLGVDVESLLVDADRIRGVVTREGVVHAPEVVLAAGAWANQLVAPLGCGLAMAPVRSQYWLTEPDPLFPRAHPVVILPDARAYTRPELGALLFGLRERESISLDPRGLPADMSGYAFLDDADGWGALEDGASALRRFLPALDRIRIRRHVAGASTYTPDGLFLAGKVPGIDGLSVASGCCGAGIAASGGLGQILASFALDEAPSFDVSPFRPDRFGPVDPFDPTFRARCAATRSGKTAG